MSPESAEVVSRVYEAANRGDFDAAYSWVHPEVVYHTYADAPEAGIYRGREAVRRYNERLFGQFERVRYDVEELVDGGDRVVAVVTHHAVPKGGSQGISVRFAEAWRLRGGLLAERRSYSTREEALEALGLSG